MRRVLIVGGGRVGCALAASLAEDGHPVTVIECDAPRAEQLAGALPAVEIVHGDGTEPVVLELVGIRRQDVVAAVTGTDATNALVCALARLAFGVPRTIARLVDPTHAWLLTADMGTDVVFDQAALLAGLVAEDLSLGEVATLTRLRRGAFTLVEERLPPSAPVVGRPVSDLEIPGGLVVAVFRGDTVLPAQPTVRLQPDDEVLAVLPTGTSRRLAAALAGGDRENGEPAAR
jgi:trk system potassium uptake protein